MEFSALNPAYENIETIGDEQVRLARLNAWRTGQTGIPLIDACMRCLMCTGFLNFRMRAMLVTTACFGMQLHWRDLVGPLAQVFADYEPGIHISQIQMQAGVVGINTLRVYSPQKQFVDQDADARFVKRWVPELAQFSAEQIAGYETTVLGDYPPPVCDIASNAKLMKDQLYAIRRSDEGREAAKRTLKEHGSRKPARRNGKSRSRADSGRVNARSGKGNADSQMSFDW
jgi:deoxyribodipyrimidine photo-lyase